MKDDFSAHAHADPRQMAYEQKRKQFQEDNGRPIQRMANNGRNGREPRKES